MAQDVSKPKITLIGPTLPFRGGVAQYTTLLHQVLQKHADVQTISFKRLYPKWLYPGESDTAPGTEKYREPGVEYVLDVYNPLSLRKATDKIIEQGSDLVIIDWWTLFWQPGLAYMARRLRRHGIKTAFLCHNLFDHDARGIKRKLSERLLKQADAYVVQSGEQRAMLAALKPSATILQRIHPINTMFPSPSRQLPKRGQLELLFFGLIRPYKGLDILLDALASLQDREVYLTIAGEPWGDKQALLRKIEAANIPNLETKLEYVSDQEAADYMDRADAVVLPYRSATGSGVVALAYNYGKPVIATRVGGLQDAVVDGQTGILLPPESPEALAQAITATSREQLVAMRPNIEKFCEQNSWDAMAKAIRDFAQAL